MSGVASSELKAYFAEARTWDQDRLAAAYRSRRLAWTVAAVAAGLAGAAVAAVIVLTPLKTVEPYVVRVDRTTGAIEVLRGLSTTGPQSYEEAVTKSFLATYVRAREGWLPQAAEANFRQVSIMSTPEEQQRWALAYRPTNPASPQITYGRGADVDVSVRAISFVAPGVANIRFHRSVRRDAQVEESDWIATIAFAYTKAPMGEVDRLRNPLGFQVSSYRADPEVVR
ncbi:MAG: conjugal transfer protein TraJ [Phenylobacterium sp. RIFCSPHIGHO2_01_FULL_69_31]|uniref:virB8 family protein n=1 Tax=Phenylobacterium sp. RIFCSPHIGHO2_01_FULL_69_31 TaxID=1801944 RepID=UPI0008B91754|nr:VirB8/TrbF family protein [Phenylobacterium sp. RIFCSPHIGHO2_01_FULL_69_31]OHB26244.1 MAG: conjugal transfer protein TraJ [Phenylobacterium sp. RIFCSPHIGHO2_01_FULL_69_31]